MHPSNSDDFRYKVTQPAILESESMVAAAMSIGYTRDGIRYSDWTSVLFWDHSGDGEPTTKTFTSRVSAFPGSVAYKSRVFLNAGNDSYRIVDGDPAVPDRTIGFGPGGYLLGAVSDRYIIFHTSDAFYHGTDILFVDSQSMAVVGTVTTSIRTARVAIGENEIFLASEKGGKVKLHRMAMPDFSRNAVVKAKLSGVPGVYSWIEHFSALYAVVIGKGGREIVVRWADPSNGGKPRIYQSPERPLSRWFESDGRLGVIGTYPSLWISHVRFNADGSYGFEPSGMPRGFHRLGFHSFGPRSVFVAGPTSMPVPSSKATWSHRVSLAPGRQLYVDPAVAEERDGRIRFRITLDQASDLPVTFDYQTANRSAVAGEDFTRVSGSAILEPGETETFVEVPLLEDYQIERPETLELQITGLSGAFCDELRTPGRIRGSGIRVLEEVATDDGSVLATLDGSVQKFGGVHSLDFPGGTVVARDHGFEQFVPIAENGGSYYYARGQLLGSDLFVLCQFDPARGELTEVFDNEAPRKRVGDQLIVKKGEGYVRYGFFDGFPVVSMKGEVALEGGGAQTLAVSSERTSGDLGFSVEWADPAESTGPVAFSLTPSGDLAFHIDPADDGIGTFDKEPSIFVTLSQSGWASTSRQRTGFVVADAEAVSTSPVPITTAVADVLAAGGNRLWLGKRGSSLLEGMKFENGSLIPAGTVNLPAGARLDWQSARDSGLSGQGIALEGDRMLTGFSYSFLDLGAVFVTGPGSSKPALKLNRSVPSGSANLVFSSYQAVGVVPGLGDDGTVHIFDSRSGKKVAQLKAPVAEQSFGHSLAFSGNTLWVSAPRPGEGKVYGFSVPGFTPTKTLVSPEPIRHGAFGQCIAGSAEHLIVGEPALFSPGAAWVFTPAGDTLVKRLASGARHGSDGFGGRVAARAGRLLVGSSAVSPELYHMASPPLDWPVGLSAHEPDGAHHQALLWETPEGPGIPLRASCSGLGDHASGWAMALLEGCAVLASRGPNGGALEFYEFDVSPP